VNKSRRALLAIVVIASVFIIIAPIGWPEVRYRMALRKYRFGATAETLERETGARIKLRKNGNYLGETRTTSTSAVILATMHALTPIT
jgi:hypothetical protein